MKKLSRSFLRVGGIIDLVCAGMCFFGVIVFALLASPIFTDIFVKGIESGNVQTSSNDTPEQIVFVLQLVFLGLSITFAFLIGCLVVAAIFSFKALNNYNRKMLITNIVLGFVMGSNFSAAAGILGLIALAREDRNKARSNIIDAE